MVQRLKSFFLKKKRGSVEKMLLLLRKLKKLQKKEEKLTDLPIKLRRLVLHKDKRAEDKVARHYRRVRLVKKHISQITNLLEKEIVKVRRKLKLPRK